MGGRPNWHALTAAPLASFLAGVLFVLYIASITWAVPRIGLGTAALMVLVGQLISAALIDHVGSIVARPTNLTLRRSIGLSLVVLGAVLARTNHIWNVVN